MKKHTFKSLTAFIIIVSVIVISVTGWILFDPGALILEGQVEATQIKVSSKLTGRVENLYIKEGDRIEKGELLVYINSPELEAKYEQALAAQKAASAQKHKAMSGAREEEVRAARDQWLKAKTGTVLAEKTFLRTEKLFNDGAVSQQKYDEAEAQYAAAKKTEDTAKAQYDMAFAGARIEDKESAQALLEQASGMVAEVRAYLRETRLSSPISGEVVDILAEQGELVAQGYPIITIIDTSDMWITLNVREDLLNGLKIGDTLYVQFPAFKNQDFTFEVNYISALGDYATWRATKSTGDFDLRTFEVRAKSKTPIASLRAGMTALVNWDKSIKYNLSKRK